MLGVTESGDTAQHGGVGVSTNLKRKSRRIAGLPATAIPARCDPPTKPLDNAKHMAMLGHGGGWWTSAAMCRGAGEPFQRGRSGRDCGPVASYS
jgi:hypothetical protein